MLTDTCFGRLKKIAIATFTSASSTKKALPTVSPAINPDEHELSELKKLVNNHTTPQQIALRARIILDAKQGLNNMQIVKNLDIGVGMVRLWRKRWVDLLALCPFERLSDAERAGAPAKFTPEQICKLIAIACEPPGDSGRPISHWAARELADELILRGIVESISSRHVSRLLKEADLKPHRSRYWLTPQPDPQFNDKVMDICSIYQRAQDILNDGGRVISTDEMTGIQAIERKNSSLPMKPGKVERIEFEYIRHGTLTLIANIDVATGEVISPYVGPTRTEQDFVAHIKQTIQTDLSANKWHFVVDNLNTHKSESLVKFVSSVDNLDIDLGIKGKSGILKSQESRENFLNDSDHKIVFHYTPKHSSWLNQIEMWFSILVRKLLKRASFSSLAELETRLIAFIKYFNDTMAKPFKWTYKGKVLAV